MVIPLFFRESQRRLVSIFLFKQPEGILTGDLTTDYCALSEEAVAKVKSLLPDTKSIFLMRNPVDRAWSHTKMLLPGLLGKSFAQISVDELLDYLSHPAPQMRGNYPRTLEIWEGMYGQQQLFTGFFEEVADCPRELYIRLLDYLRVRSGKEYIPEGLDRKVNVSKVSEIESMPEAIRQSLNEIYRHDLEWLAERFGGVRIEVAC